MQPEEQLPDTVDNKRAASYKRASSAMSPAIIALVSEHPQVELILQTARHHAEQSNTRWHVVHVETPEFFLLSETEQERVNYYLSRAEFLGAEVHQISGDSIIASLERFVGDVSAGHLVVGRTKPSWYEKLWQSDTHKRLMNAFPDLSIQFVPLSKSGRKIVTSKDSNELSFLHIFSTASLVVLLTLALVELLQRLMAVYIAQPLDPYNITMLFLITNMATALRYGLTGGMITAVLSLFAINYFYMEPVYAIASLNSADFINMFLFIVSAALATLFGSYSKQRSEITRQRERLTNTLYRLSRQVVGAGDYKHVVKSLRSEMERVFETGVAIFLAPDAPVPENSDIKLKYPKHVHLSSKDERALKRCWRGQLPTGCYSLVEPSIHWRFEPLTTSSGRIGVLAVYMTGRQHFGRQDRKLLSAITDMTSIALERATLERRLSESRMLEQREVLRSSLLSSVSHDLKTPLASIIGSLSAIQHMKDQLDDAAKESLIDTALVESQRLNRFISNILEMTRLESEAVTPSISSQNVYELVQQVTTRLERTSNEKLKLELIAKNKEVEAKLDPMLFEQLLQNLLDNAKKYAPSDTHIRIELKPESTQSSDIENLLITIEDNGIGINEQDRERIFSKFHRLAQKDSKVAGTGLGLAICKAISDIHNADIWADSPEYLSGSRFVIRLKNVSSAKNYPVKEDTPDASAIALARTELEKDKRTIH